METRWNYAISHQLQLHSLQPMLSKMPWNLVLAQVELYTVDVTPLCQSAATEWMPAEANAEHVSAARGSAGRWRSLSGQ